MYLMLVRSQMDFYVVDILFETTLFSLMYGGTAFRMALVGTVYSHQPRRSMFS